MVGLVAAQAADADALVKVLSGQLVPGEYGGEVRIGGVKLEDLDLAESRRTLLVEPHRTDLFTGSLRSNLFTGDDAGAGDHVDAALRSSCAVEVVEVHGGDLDHGVTERGASLSGGQRQRLTLARALLRRAPVLVLHEPTSAVDAVTESVVAQGIGELRHGPRGRTFTTLIVTCSPALLAATDRVVFLDGGRVAATGSHAELMVRADYQSAVLR
jgi:putative ABC transport system ATP-binding protein